MRPSRIILHHSATKDSGTVSWNAIRRFHTHTHKWLDIGYHAGVELVKDAAGEEHYEVFMGRPWDMTGAHTAGQNSRSLGLCFVGNFDDVKPSERMLVEGRKIVGLWMDLFNIPISEIFGHRDFAQKTCPGRLFDVEQFRKSL